MPFCSPLGHPDDADEVDDFIDALWNYANRQEMILVNAEQLRELGVSFEFDIDIESFEPFYFKLLPIEEPGLLPNHRAATDTRKPYGNQKLRARKKHWESSDIRKMGPNCMRRSSDQMFV